MIYLSEIISCMREMLRKTKVLQTPVMMFTMNLSKALTLFIEEWRNRASSQKDSSRMVYLTTAGSSWCESKGALWPIQVIKNAIPLGSMNSTIEDLMDQWNLNLMLWAEWEWAHNLVKICL